MDERVAQHLEDLLNALDRIQTLTVDMDEQSYCAEDAWMIRAAVERFIIIGAEALIWLRHHESTVFATIPDGAGAISLRNVLVHQYQHVDDDVIWRTVVSSLPGLRAQTSAILLDSRMSQEPPAEEPA